MSNSRHATPDRGHVGASPGRPRDDAADPAGERRTWGRVTSADLGRTTRYLAGSRISHTFENWAGIFAVLAS